MSDSSKVTTPSIKVYCESSVEWPFHSYSDVCATIYRHEWQMRYEVAMAYLLQTCNERLPEDRRIEEHGGVQLGMLLRGIVALRNMNCEAADELRYMLIETLAALLRYSSISTSDLPLIDDLTCTDVADICVCRSFVTFMQSAGKKSFVFDMLKFVITWKNAVVKNSSSDKPSPADALAIVKLVLYGIDFTTSLY